MNFTFLSKFDQLENQVNSVTNNQHNIVSNVNGQTSHIQNILNDIKEEQSWISPITVDVNTKGLEDGQGEATFKWQVKELQNDSEIVFNYAHGNNEDYTALPAEEVQQGLFRVKIPFDVDSEPLWEVALTASNSNKQQEMSKKEMEEERMEEHRQNALKYFVSVSYEDMVKSGEVQTKHLGDIGTSYYGIIQTNIHMQNEYFRVSLINHNVNDSSILVEEAYLKKYADKKLLGEEKIELDKGNTPSDQRVRIFHLNEVELLEDMRLVIKVIYSNGETFEKEVY